MPGLADTCGVCEKAYTYSLARCGFCRRPVCGDCGARVSRIVFCGRTCSHSFFYGAEEDIEEEDAASDKDE